MSCPRGCCVDYKTHLRNVSIGSFPTAPTITERRWDKDMPAFKRLVDDGLMPAHIDGSYVMEREAIHPKEIELGHAIDLTTLAVMDDAGI